MPTTNICFIILYVRFSDTETGFCARIDRLVLSQFMPDLPLLNCSTREFNVYELILFIGTFSKVRSQILKCVNVQFVAHGMKLENMLSLKQIFTNNT